MCTVLGLSERGLEKDCRVARVFGVLGGGHAGTSMCPSKQDVSYDQWAWGGTRPIKTYHSGGLRCERL